MFVKAALLTLMILAIWHKCSCQSGDFVQCNGAVGVSSCSNHTCSYTIPSLDYEISTDVDSIQIQLCTSYSELSTVVTFNNFSHVELRGNSINKSTVRCTGKQSGIEFFGVRNINIENFWFSWCGMDISYVTGIEAASIFILNSVQVALNNIFFAFSKDTAVAMIKAGNSTISNCTFSGLPIISRRGLYLEIVENSTYHNIHGNSFIANWAANPCNTAFSTFYGAGITVLFQNYTADNLVEISDCKFEHNHAKLGGALYVKFNSSQDNLVLATKSEFYHNDATEGGAIALEFVMVVSLSINNTVRVVRCNFTENTASKGGSLYIISTVPPPCRQRVQNRLELKNSTCIHNTAFKGAAIDANLELFDAEGELPLYNLIVIELNDTSFEKNYVRMKQSANSQHQSCQGTIRTVQGVELIISGMLQMSNSTGSALCLKSSIVSFMPNSKSIFRGNRGQQGGAIAIMGDESQVKLHNNCSIILQDNTAKTHGGGIFQEFGRQCFLKREGGGNKKPVLIFSNNTANNFGHSIYVATVQPCSMDEFFHDLAKFLPNIANFSFPQKRKYDISTKSGKITIFPEKLVPGKVASIFFRDETNTSIEAVFMITANHSSINSGVSLEASLMPNTGNSQVRLLGRPQTKTDLLISPLNQPDFQVSINIELADCPPGFYYDHDSRACLCSGNSDISNRYVGIENCPPNTFQASLLHGHWAGYVSGRNRSNDSENDELVLLTGYCPRGFCTSGSASGISLPAHVPSNHDLSSTVCRENREGILCSQCIANYSAAFTTYRDCLPDEKCRLGFLYFILSQIVPITIAFSVMVASDTSLTSGAVSGAIFYAQMFPFLLVTANDFIWFERKSFELLRGLRAIIAMFNLRFFAIRKFSFCLWKGITLLDIAMVNYATVLYSLGLIILTVKVFTPCIRKLKNYRSNKNKKEKQHSSKSIIHGLTGFLVVSYSQCTTISLYIMAYVELYSIGMKPYVYRVFHNAELEYFKGRHLFYAIPAVFFLVFMSLIPPLFLFVYPLCYRVLALCRIQESKFTKILCRAIPLEKYKPLFDSFQESFKDKHRYFAGLFFIFRLVIITTYVITRELANYYLFLEIELVIMLMLVAYFQPHKKDWHNVLDSLIFILLIIINTGTIFLYRRQSKHSRIQYSFEYTDIYQVLLAYLPLLYLLAYVILKGIMTVKKMLIRKRRTLVEDDTDLVLSVLSQRENPEKFEYSLYQERELSQ